MSSTRPSTCCGSPTVGSRAALTSVTPESRKFLFSAGVGLDASVVEVVNAHPRLKARVGEWYYTVVTLRIFHGQYLLHPPRLEVAAGEKTVLGVSAFVQNGPPYTYFGDRPIVASEGATLESGDLAAAVLKRANPIDLPTIAWRALSKRAQVGRHRQIEALSGIEQMHVRSVDGRPLPLEVDGDYIGTVEELDFSVVPAALKVVA